MKTATRTCDFCGDPSKWGYYRIDGMSACDTCGDFLIHLDASLGVAKPVSPTSRDDESPKVIELHPGLGGEMDSPCCDRLMGRTVCQGDLVICGTALQEDAISDHPAEVHKFLITFKRFSECLGVQFVHFFGGSRLKASSSEVRPSFLSSGFRRLLSRLSSPAPQLSSRSAAPAASSSDSE